MMSAEAIIDACGHVCYLREAGSALPATGFIELVSHVRSVHRIVANKVPATQTKLAPACSRCDLDRAEDRPAGSLYGRQN
jgi:predicted HNH restriction endonuclease